MTSFAFIMGVVPLVTASGAGSEMRQAIGIAVFSGMLGVTLFGLFLTPVFFVTIEGLLARRPARPHPPAIAPPAMPPRSRPVRDASSSQRAARQLRRSLLAGCAVGPDYHRPETPVDRALRQCRRSPDSAPRRRRRALLDRLRRSAARLSWSTMRSRITRICRGRRQPAGGARRAAAGRVSICSRP